MSFFRRSLLCSLLALGALLPSGDAQAVTYLLSPAETGISNARLSNAPSMTIRVTDYQAASVYVSLTRNSATTVKMDCSSGPTSSVQAPIAVAQVDSSTGAIVMVPASWNYPVTKTATLRMQVAPLNDTFLVCKFSGTGASSDTISVYAQLGG